MAAPPRGGRFVFRFLGNEAMDVAPLAAALQLLNLLLTAFLVGGFVMIVVALRSIAQSLRAIARALRDLADRQPPPLG